MSTVDDDRRFGRLLATSATALVAQFALQIACGIFLARAYIPDPAHAHRTMQQILSAQPHAFIAGLHYWGSAVLIAHSFLHIVLSVWAGGYRQPRQWSWWGGIILFVCALMFQLTGNLLPFDRHGVQTANVESGVAGSMPVLGPNVARIILQGSELSASTLSAWYFIHRWVLPLLMIVGVWAILFGGRERRPAHRVWAVAPLAIVILLAAILPAPLGNPATAADYSGYNATVSWYVWPMHGALNAFNKISPSLGWIGSGVLPALFIGFLVLLPFLAKRMTGGAVQTVFGVFLGIFAVLALGFGGRFAPLTGNRDPAVEQVSNQASTRPIDGILASRGRELFNSQSCADCHGKDGKEASGGPSLAKVNEKYSDAQWYVEFIANPKSKHPESTMPAFPELSVEQRRAIAEYLRGPH